ncbi:MAG: EF-Tu/IF-2/RF-3 family GTPase, partial [Bacteroidota bacterium]
KMGWMGADWAEPTSDITYLLDQIIEYVPEPEIPEGTLQMQITSLDYSNYLGRIAIGRVFRGSMQQNKEVVLIKRDGKQQKMRLRGLYNFEGLGRTEVKEIVAGDIAALVGLEGFEIGDTVSDVEHPDALPPIRIDEPTMSMLFTINDSPFFGKEGKFVTSRHLRDRFEKELEKNLALRVEATEKADAWRVFGRGVLHLSVLIETMRREGYELQIGQPQVIIKEIDGVKSEPVEELTIDLPDEMSGKAIELVTRRKGVMLSMESKGERSRLEFEIPSRGLIGLRNILLTTTAGEAIVTHRFKEFQPHKGDIPGRINGSLISMETGKSIPYSIFNLQERGKFFIGANEEIYEGQVVGENTVRNGLTGFHADERTIDTARN